MESGLLAPIGHAHSSVAQPKAVLEPFLEWVGEPIEFRLVGKRVPDPEYSPSSAARASEPERGFNLADPEVERRFVARRRFDFDAPPSAAIGESKIEAVAIARVVELSGHERQHVLADFRDPGIRRNHFAAEFLLQEPVGMHVADDTDEFSKLG